VQGKGEKGKRIQGIGEQRRNPGRAEKRQAEQGIEAE